MKKLKQTLSRVILASSLVSLNTFATIVGEPEANTGLTEKQQVVAHKYMVSAANPYAVEAGAAVLAKGGSAVDAAIAVQLVLTLVEPQSSGIGGGLFLLHYDKSQQHLTSFDGRETAPAKATESLFLDGKGKPIRWIEAVVGGRSVGVPGALAALNQAHSRYGKLPWAELFVDAIKLSENGFIVSPRLEKLVSLKINPGVSLIDNTKAYFMPNGEPLKAGTVKKNPELAALYREIAEKGVLAFYQGDNAKQLVNTVTKSDIAPGTISEQDLANYRSVERKPVCAPYKAYNVCSMAPPSSGGITVLQIMALLEQSNAPLKENWDVDSVHAFTQASRLAFADRDFYIADPDFVKVPTENMLNATYLKERSLLISQSDMGRALPGDFSTDWSVAQVNYEQPNTSHVSIVDADGNAVSMTTSIEMGFGSALMVNGYLLNNQLTDFTFNPKIDGKPVANRVEPIKRPRSSMAPVMVFNKDGTLKLVIGSPGGSRIINYVAKALVGILDFGLSPQQAIELANITNRNRVTTLEKGSDIEFIKPALEAKGHTVVIRDLNSGIHAVMIEGDKLLGAADPRREGIALGQ
ncbi:gamma-glutamyltransferase [Pseudoalteromonas sp. G4]|uniref:gamma-glutamyltransferase n=1 Tax=Pseudoalteromonas sp. G4 TaxID=2992761 RepID=UPI00237E600F|nr:gamma-glutamyltransferase [Pseudoalteromonas sp. G4]MDE3270776.1 gamma-glutamyltransferase [Pseudoalteromonas sp. G4]